MRHSQAVARGIGFRMIDRMLPAFGIIFCSGFLAACTGGNVIHGVPVSTSSSPSTTTPSVPTTLPGGQVLPAGAAISSVVQFQNHHVAAGSYFPGTGISALPNCSPGCNPVVWTSAKESRWCVTLQSPATGSITGEELVLFPSGLLLFNSDEGTALWRSTDAVDWQRVPLPGQMAALGVTACVWSHGRFVAILSNKFGGGPNTAYGQSDTICNSTDGITWIQSPVNGPPAVFKSLVANPNGFTIGGYSRDTGTQTVWTSSDGISWVARAADRASTQSG